MREKSKFSPKNQNESNWVMTDIRKVIIMTKREFYVALTNGTMNDEIKAFAADQIAKLDHTNETRRNKLSKKQLENEGVKGEILNHLGADAKTATVIGEEMEISTQKASALLRQLVADGKASVIDVKVTGKGIQKGYIIG